MITWRREWRPTTQYAVGDAVAYEGSSYIVHTIPPVGALPTDVTFWDLLAAQGSGILTPRGEWNETMTYAEDDTVIFEGSSYFAIRPVPPNRPPPDASFWQELAARGAVGLRWRGVWNENTEYQANDGVFFDKNGAGYIATTQVPAGTKPTDVAFWDVLARAGVPPKLSTAEVASIVTGIVSALGTATAASIALATALGKTPAFNSAAVNAATTALATATSPLSQAVAGMIGNAVSPVQQLAQNADTAAQNATQAAQNADTAAQNAGQLAQTATTTAQNASQLAQTATTAAQSATQAAQNASQFAQEAANTLLFQTQDLDQQVQQLISGALATG